jgi:hypothetical protein
MLRNSTVVYWKNHATEEIGNEKNLMSKEEADKTSSSLRYTSPDDQYYSYKAVALIDEQLQLITDEKSEKAKEIMLTLFNPFLTKAIKYKKEEELGEIQKVMFLRGLDLKNSDRSVGQENASPLKSVLAQNTLFHLPVIREIFSYLGPTNPSKTPSLSRGK